ncbi:hypothetical protein BDN72DRAFT_159217 [Pluteus cervinus]|uniref:Uncharacterized protein n=1 Tax=Pluteus cervinus TaxID=181527 RepID=A0ACD3AKQ6_9AGAR|nr:hypothetical protein BDN72DRAFT_159217 [Pluteus cervinus]
MDLADVILHGKIPLFVEILEGYRVSKMVTFALLTLTVYEYLITFEQERRYFWTGPWTISRILFLLNRYMLPLVNLLVAYNYAIPSADTRVCGIAVQLAFIFGVGVMSVVQAALVTRLWYLFSHNKYMQLGIITSFLVSLILGWYFMYMSVSPIMVIASSTKDRFMSGCASTYPEKFWRVYAPSLVLHTLLYALTAYRALRNRRLLKQTPVLMRLMRDGGLYLLVVFLTVGITSIASFFEEKPKYYLVAVFSPSVPDIHSTLRTSPIHLLSLFQVSTDNDFDWTLKSPS